MFILFVCTGNTCRSPMAEFIAKDFFRKNLIKNKVNSCAISGSKGISISFNAKKTMEELNIFIKNYKSKLINKDIIKKADFILTMTKSQKEIVLKNYNNYYNKIKTLSYLAIRKEIDIPDPFMESIEKYKKCRDLIKYYIEKIKWKEI